MKNIDWTTYKFHCSFLPTLMTASRSKSDLLSQTAKAGLMDIWIKNTYGREKSDMLANKYTQKGIMCETDSIELLERVTGQKYFKNNEQLENEFIVGTPDIKTPSVIDIKTSWDLFTFASVDEEKATKDYEYQLLGYMNLTGSTSSLLTYCLVNTPQEMIAYELYRLSFKAPEDVIEKYKNNYIFDDIPEEKRVKSYPFVYSEEKMNSVQTRIMQSREYLSTLSI